jgi:hypothetical protein
MILLIPYEKRLEFVLDYIIFRLDCVNFPRDFSFCLLVGVFYDIIETEAVALLINIRHITVVSRRSR